MAEWSKANDSKSFNSFTIRGFKSHPLRYRGFFSSLVFITLSYPFLKGRENLKKVYWDLYFYFADIQKNIEEKPKLDFIILFANLLY